EYSVKWKRICEFFCIVPRVSPFPELLGLGQRKYISIENKSTNTINRSSKGLKADESPWIIPQSNSWDCLDIESGSLISQP
ncbi:hypothetical protein, partial [Aliarcobacter cryaerophilus]|uniref:hypothetical protein n=1 Tax=Aliarcobacter cryaerophilus TaxID=28198 RepID=UPI001CA345F3